MPTVHLNDRKLRSLATEKPQEDFWDENFPKFGVRVTGGGRRTFVVRYVIGRRKRRYSLGTYPTLSLAGARDKAKAVLYDVAQGSDPQAEKAMARRADTFTELADLYLERHARRYKKSWREDERKLKKDILPAWGHLGVQDLKRRDVIHLIEDIAAGVVGGRKKPAPIAANRVLALVSRIFNFAIDEEIVEFNPAQRVRRVAPETGRDRVLTEDEIATVWPHLDRFHPIMAAFWKLALLTAQRPGEIKQMRWQDLDGDWWTIPAELSKNGRSHRVPLPAQAKAIIEELRPLTGSGEWVLASWKKKRDIPLYTTTKANARLLAWTGFDRFTPHDLRRTAATFMTSMGIHRLTVAKILNHAERGVTATYDRASYDLDKRRALTRWADKLAEIVSKRRGSEASGHSKAL